MCPHVGGTTLVCRVLASAYLSSEHLTILPLPHRSDTLHGIGPPPSVLPRCLSIQESHLSDSQSTQAQGLQHRVLTGYYKLVGEWNVALQILVAKEAEFELAKRFCGTEHTLQ